MATSKKQRPDEDVVHYVSERKKRGRPKPKMQPQMTPMIDVTFQLLLFFLLTMTFRPTEGQIPAELPELGQNQGTPPLVDPVFVYVRGSETTPKIQIVDVNETIETWPRLRAVLQKRFVALGENPEVPVVIKADEDATWTHMIGAFHQASQSPFKVVAFASELGKPEKTAL